MCLGGTWGWTPPLTVSAQTEPRWAFSASSSVRRSVSGLLRHPRRCTQRKQQSFGQMSSFWTRRGKSCSETQKSCVEKETPILIWEPRFRQSPPSQVSTDVHKGKKEVWRHLKAPNYGHKPEPPPPPTSSSQNPDQYSSLTSKAGAPPTKEFSSSVQRNFN